MSHATMTGPEIRGPRLTVYHLLDYFFDPTMTEAAVAHIYDLTPEQVAAARAYVFANLETVLANHLAIEKRLAVGNPPEVVERARETQTLLLQFQEWLVQRQAEDREARKNSDPTTEPPTFREWITQQKLTGV